MLLHHILEQQAARQGDRTAMVAGGESVTYGELDDLTRRLARLLQDAGCKPGDRVGILLPKSIPAIAGYFGALKAGCIYVPLDTSSPAPRLAKMVAACEPRCVLANRSTAGLLEAVLSETELGSSVRVGWADSGTPQGGSIQAAFRWNDLATAPPPTSSFAGTDSLPVHILFTSGSTGVPKGVVITHSNVLSFINWAIPYFGTESTDRVSCHPPLHFDLSTFDIYGSFLAGAELHLVPPEISLLPHKIAEFIRGSGLTQWFSVPSVFKYMAQFDAVRYNDFPELRRLLWCGEALPTPTLVYWMTRLPRVRFTNLYGPTEATIASSYYTVPACPESETAEIPIGTPCRGEELMVLDESLQPVPAGEVGDLYIGGAGLSPGYWRDPQKTQAVFINHPERGRIYKTGDLARVGPDGLVYLLGRADSQIKSRGYRIELGEIEAALHALGILSECAVVAVPTARFEGIAICCAYVLKDGMPLEPADIRERLSELLPSYMLPGQWMPLEAMPLNANGKIDRPWLKEQFRAAASAA